MKGLFPHPKLSALHAIAHRAYLTLAVHNSMFACLTCREEDRVVASGGKRGMPKMEL